MARPIRVSVSGIGVSAPIVLSSYNRPFNIGVGVKLTVAASLTYTVQHTYDDVFASTFDPATATWYTSQFGGNQTPKTADADGNYSAPITATRLNISAWTSGTATMTVIPAGY